MQENVQEIHVSQVQTEEHVEQQTRFQPVHEQAKTVEVPTQGTQSQNPHFEELDAEMNDEEVNPVTGVKGLSDQDRDLQQLNQKVYQIKGVDNNGPFESYRRFNQFFKARKCIVNAWPGCYVPALPDKDPLNKNDEEVINKRKRMLGQFLRKLASLPHIFYSQQTQSLLRSKQLDLCSIYDKWPKQPLEQIIKRYQDCFSQLAGKQINAETSTKISNFYNMLKKSLTLIGNYKDMARRIAESRGKVNNLGSLIFASALPVFQKACIRDMVEQSAKILIYNQTSKNYSQIHSDAVLASVKYNPYWLIYDIMKLEQRDGQAMIQAVKNRDVLEQKGKSIDLKIRENEAQIVSLSSGGKSLKSMVHKGSKQDYKAKLEAQNLQMSVERKNISALSDIISALLAYITIDQYLNSKRAFYYTRLKKLLRLEEVSVRHMTQVWTDLSDHYRQV